MNLWGKGTGLLFLSALFVFSSCKDELNKIGTSSDQDKFQVYYKEFTLPSATVLYDSVRADNTPRFLVGGYEDALYGKVETTPYVAFSTTSEIFGLKTSVDSDSLIVDVIIDSIVFNTQLDNYHYGANRGIDETLTLGLHKISNKFISDDYNFNHQEYDYEADPLAVINIAYHTDSLDDQDSIFNHAIKLPATYLSEFKEVISLITTKHPTDSAYNDSKELVPTDSTNVSLISDYLFGFALKTVNGAEDVIGLNNNNSTSLGTYLAVHYHTTSGNFVFPVASDGSSFNNIKADRAGTPISEVTEREKAYESGGTRYVQAGIGITTQLSLDEVNSFMNTQTNMIINSAEFDFENVISTELQPAPDAFNLLHVTKGFDRTTLPLNGADVSALFNDSGEVGSFLYDDTNNSYQVFPVRYLQSLYENKIAESNLIVRPVGNGYSIDRFAINKGDIKLKLYYSLPNQ